MFTRFVEVGRAVVVNAGPDSGKLAVIVDILDHNRAIIECPQTGVKRQVLSYKRMSLTDLKIALKRGTRAKHLRKCVEAEQLVSKWNATEFAQKLASKERRANLNDFERFQASVLRKIKTRILKTNGASA